MNICETYSKQLYQKINTIKIQNNQWVITNNNKLKIANNIFDTDIIDTSNNCIPYVYKYSGKRFYNNLK